MFQNTKLYVMLWKLNVVPLLCFYAHYYLRLECPYRFIQPHFSISPQAWHNLIRIPTLKGLLPWNFLWNWVGIIHPMLLLYLWFRYIFAVLSLMNIHFFPLCGILNPFRAGITCYLHQCFLCLVEGLHA